METLIYKNSDELAQEYARWFVTRVTTVLKDKEFFTVCLSGGSTPKKLFRLLAGEPFRTTMPWSRLHFFWGDELFVPFSDERNNARMAFEELLDQVEVNKDHIYVMDTGLEPAESVKHYDTILRRYFSDGSGFDLVMLGLGDNAHTLSLFPGYPIVHDDTNWVAAFFLTGQDMFRISLTRVIVNRSACITYLVAGADKAKAVHEVIEGAPNADLYPAQVIKNGDGELIWFLDELAAAELRK